jgi:hypothetical protein
MMGYALRTEPARGRRDPLAARALYLRSGPGGDPGLLLVVLDVCLIAVSQAAEVRARIAAQTALPVERILVCCTHTHAGPETGLAAAHEKREAPPQAEALLAAAAQAGVEAVAAAAPARLGVGCGAARIGRNRACADGPVDAQALVVRVDREVGGDATPLAVVFVHGCHPTVLGHEHLEYSADWPGAAARTIEASLRGVTAIYACGAHGDVDPRTRGLQDVAREGRSLGVAPEEMETLGREIGLVVAEAAAAIETAGDAIVGAATTRVRLGVPGAALAPEARAAWLERRFGEAVAALGLPPGEAPQARDLFRIAHERSRDLPPDAARDRIGRVRLYLRDRQAPYYASGLAQDVELHVLRLGGALLLALPFEASAEVGLDWKDRALALAAGAGSSGRPIGAAGLVSLANGWLRYLPHPRHFEGPAPHHRYDVLTSSFQPDAGDLLLRAGEALARDLLG